jgi:mRNA interferase RelE/StbE
MKYRIELTAGAEEDLERLTIEMARRVSRLMDLIEENPVGPPAEALAGDLRGLYRMRSGDHRIVYSVDRDRRVVTIEAIAPRAIVYDVVVRRLR